MLAVKQQTSELMRESKSGLDESFRRFKRAMLPSGTALLLLEIALLGAVGKHVPIPERFSTTVFIVGVAAVFLVGCIVFIPLWLLSDRLRKHFGLLCPHCGKWLSARLDGRVCCKRCEKGTADGA
jgi:hypothetical protein